LFELVDLVLWLYEKSEVNSRSKLLPSAPPSAAETSKATTATEATATAKAITAATAKTITPEASAAAALEILETLTGKIATRSVLSLAIQVLRPTSAARSVEAATGTLRASFTGSIVTAAFTGAIRAARFR